MRQLAASIACHSQAHRTCCVSRFKFESASLSPHSIPWQPKTAHARQTWASSGIFSDGHGRRLPAKFGAESLLQVLDQIAKGGGPSFSSVGRRQGPGRRRIFCFSGSYDFVYVPHDKRKDRNLSLAFMNFVDHETAQCLDFGQRNRFHSETFSRCFFLLLEGTVPPKKS